MTTTYNVSIEGISPMLHHSAAAVGMEITKKKKGGIAIEGDPNEWKTSIYFDEEAGVFLPALNVEACFIQAAKQFKITGRQTASAYFKSGVFCETDKLPFYVSGKQIKKIEEIGENPDTSILRLGVKNPSTRARNTRYRAQFYNWSSQFNLIVAADDYITADLLKEVIEYAGSYIGLGDFRPRFGRFKVTSIKAQEK